MYIANEIKIVKFVLVFIIKSVQFFFKLLYSLHQVLQNKITLLHTIVIWFCFVFSLHLNCNLTFKWILLLLFLSFDKTNTW